ncbi:ADP-glyceromanno-heptose 6-epimerase [Magnetospirillum moscoviense]|uniref:ADP-L-glycero-D-manno-heptose-6-epimerase n=1 Tax=Magnetospirillum moscoviense TaxID=1437059 RepID=A0A178MWX3_9PROT|nr:ADP-glyceromanno-heptose 6-epimerase [Magnetospirillum moscoviense]MBF0325263.1 ADP-glyceromanno-heptose 6-epimerase [Alphaproteobacteria bacterium]OAN53988.1 ADP-L-glycero-D-mannoheptose-6-epimerase [Magnetospirillum moscoviense]
MIVVTGGAGFIGSNILAALEARDAGKLVVCDRLRANDKWKNVAKRELADIVHPEQLFDFLEANRKHVQVIFHMGAISATTETDADKIAANNFSLSLALWKWCALSNVRFIYASSAATYGDGTQGFDDDWSIEHLATLAPMNAYGWSKHLFDRRVARKIATGSRKPPQFVGLKFFNVYGPNEYHKGGQQSVVSQIYPHAKADAAYQLFRSHNPNYKDGGQMRDFIWIDDCVDVMMWMLDNPNVSGIFNVGTGKARTFKDLASAVYHALDKEPNIKFQDTPVAIRDKYQYFTQANMDRLRAAGYHKPFTSLEDGVTKYVRDYLDQADRYK